MHYVLVSLLRHVDVVVFSLVNAACAAVGHGDAGEPAGPSTEPVGALPVLQLLYSGRRRERPARPVPGAHGNALR